MSELNLSFCWGWDKVDPRIRVDFCLQQLGIAYYNSLCIFLELLAKGLGLLLKIKSHIYVFSQLQNLKVNISIQKKRKKTLLKKSLPPGVCHLLFKGEQ